MNRTKYLILSLAGLAFACNFGTTVTNDGEPTVSIPAPVIDATAPQSPDPTAMVVLAEEVCLPAMEGQAQYVNEAGGYCFLLPDEFSVDQSSGLDISAVGPTLATFGMDRLALILEFNVLGAPGGAGERDAQSWGASIAADYSSVDFEPGVEPYVFSEIGLEGVRVGPLPGMVGGEAVFVRANDTLYGITVHPDRFSFPDYSQHVEELWATINASTRFFSPLDEGTEYRTEKDVCPTEQAGTRLVTNLAAGWCALIPGTWQEDVDFPGRIVGGPEIGEFWPGQPPYANIVVGFSGPTGDGTLEERVEGRMNANGRPDLVRATDTAIGDFPAVILNTLDGPHPDRVALIDTNEFQYSVLGQPFDGARFPEAQPELEAAWETIISSIQFFEPYR